MTNSVTFKGTSICLFLATTLLVSSISEARSASGYCFGLLTQFGFIKPEVIRPENSEWLKIGSRLRAGPGTASAVHVPELRPLAEAMIKNLRQKTAAHPNIRDWVLSLAGEVESLGSYNTYSNLIMFSVANSHSTLPISNYMKQAAGRDLVEILTHRLENNSLDPLEFYDFAVEYSFWTEMFLSSEKPKSDFLNENRLSDFIIFERLDAHRASLRAIFPLALILPTMRDLDFQDFVENMPYPIFPIGMVEQAVHADGQWLSPLRMIDHDTFHAIRQLLFSYGVPGEVPESGVPRLLPGFTLAAMNTIIEEREAFQQQAFRPSLIWPRSFQRLTTMRLVWFGKYHEEYKPMTPASFNQEVSPFKISEMVDESPPGSPFGQVTHREFRNVERTWRRQFLGR